MSSLDEITFRLRKAEKLLKDAEKEFKMGLYERCCSTSYYAMFHSAKALILSINDDARTHRGTIYKIWKNRERLGLSEDDCVKLSRAFDLREESDYGIFRQISKNEAESLLNDARDFVEKVKRILNL